MTVWVDAQISPAIAAWLRWRFWLDAKHVRDLVPVATTDGEIFWMARMKQVVVLPKDRDFVELVRWKGAPPQVVWVTCGNTSNAAMCRILESTWAQARRLLEQGEPFVEIKG